MAKYQVMRYLYTITTVEAETPEQALEIEEGLEVHGELTCPDALEFVLEWSDCMGEEVRDEFDNVLIERW